MQQQIERVRVVIQENTKIQLHILVLYVHFTPLVHKVHMEVHLQHLLIVFALLVERDNIKIQTHLKVHHVLIISVLVPQVLLLQEPRVLQMVPIFAMVAVMVFIKMVV